MTFNSISFLIFFPVVVAVYFVIPKRLRKYWLLVASYYFYMSWSAKYAVLIFVSTAITYLSGLLLNKVSKEKISLRKWIVAGSFISNLGILFFFKYFNFLIENVNALVKIFGGEGSVSTIDVLLPVGISFYTFQALSYTVDVYRGEVEAERNFIRYALFVSFFPQLVAGPIERSGKLISQIDRCDKEKLFSYDKFVAGFSMMCWGMFLKMVLADHVSVFVDAVWAKSALAGATACIIAAVGFSIQIYCDFSAYSTIAIGAAKVMGFELMENFNTPYFATSIKDFWRRWHISLSTWFRDYLYIPLGGSRCKKLKKYRNIMITFLVSGLWHGADWTYVLWGGIHGLYQIIADAVKPIRTKLTAYLKINTEAFSNKLGQIAVTFSLTTFAWIFFRADDFDSLKLFLKNLFTRPDPWALFDGSLYNFGVDAKDFHVIMVALLALLAVEILRAKKNIDFGTFLLKQNLWFRWTVLITLIIACVVYGAYGIKFDSSQFIYFQF